MQQAIQDISSLDLHPGTSFASATPQYIVPDVTLREEESGLAVEINDDYLPPMRINKQYLQMMRSGDLDSGTKHYISKHLDSAKWLLKNILQRNETLKKIAEHIVKSQQAFLTTKEGKLMPMTMKQMAEELSIHESTVARAVSNKYIDCARGLLPLRDFFTTALLDEHGKGTSSRTIQDDILSMIQNEDPHHPLSDAKISELLLHKGIHCARRTIAKYRAELNLGNTQQRRKY